MALKSWVASANAAQTDYPLANLPYGVFREGSRTRIGVAIGDRILDLPGCAEQDLLGDLRSDINEACCGQQLNELMKLGSGAWGVLRARLTELLREGVDGKTRQRVENLLVPMERAEMQLPVKIGDYTDFYASIHHATRVGKRLRPENPLLPNYKYVPIGYHGRASSIVVSGTEIRRPCGQTRSGSETEPKFGRTRSLDYELEIGVFVGPGNPLGEPIPITLAEEHIFGLCLLNDWSARDLQGWEYQPLGPFLAKNFATTISPWVVTLEALEPYRMAAPARPDGDPAPLDYLSPPSGARGRFDVSLEVFLQSKQMQEEGMGPMQLSRSNLRDLYWTVAQLLTHHASNGCNLRPGDLMATGTVSGPEQGSEGCLLEKLSDTDPVKLPSGETRRFLEDGDTVIMRAYAEREKLPRIGFGECVGTVR
jgi:fumarylacetoacetase